VIEVGFALLNNSVVFFFRGGKERRVEMRTCFKIYVCQLSEEEKKTNIEKKGSIKVQAKDRK
jgi:hypothetical protein